MGKRLGNRYGGKAANGAVTAVVESSPKEKFDRQFPLFSEKFLLVDLRCNNQRQKKMMQSTGR